jgi:hypothetical protein
MVRPADRKSDRLEAYSSDVGKILVIDGAAPRPFGRVRFKMIGHIDAGTYARIGLAQGRLRT